MSAILYTTTATSTGEGRSGGRVVTEDGMLELTLVIPASMGGPGGASNPEQLFAAGWASCFHSGLKMVAAGQKRKLIGSSVSAEVSLNKSAAGGLTLSAALSIHIPGIDQTTAEDLVAAAHEVCPYSLATLGNIPVILTTTVA